MFKSGKQFAVLDESVLDLSNNTSGMPVNNHHPSSVSSLSSRHHHNGGSLARNSSPFNGSDNDMVTGGVAAGLSGAGADFDSDLLSGEDGQGISQVKWTREKIAKLLDLYGKFRVKIEDPKYRKTEIWNKIAKALSDYDGITVIGKQCWDKFRYMKARYLRAREQKRRVAAGLINGSETSMITFPYFNELQELLGDTPFEQEASALGLGKREPTDTYDNVDVEDFAEPEQANGGSKLGGVDNGEAYDDVGAMSLNGNTFASPLLSNRRKRKFTSPSNDSFENQPGSHYHNNSSHLNSHQHDAPNNKFSIADGIASFYSLNSSNNNNHSSSNGNSEAVGNALSSFMSAVIEMENRKLELFKRFVDLYEKRTATSSSSVPNASSVIAQSRLKRSTAPGSSSFSGGSIANRSSAPGSKMSAPSSIGIVSHPNSNNNNNN